MDLAKERLSKRPLRVMSRRNRARWTAAIILLGVSTWLYGGLLTNQALDTHETAPAYYRIQQYVTELRHNGFPPALFPDALHGGGFAFPLFYPPFAYLFGALLYAITGSYYLAGNLGMFASVLGSAVAMHYCASRLGSRFVAIAAAVLYISVPYRFANVFLRGAFAECWTFVWYPLIVAAGILLLQRRVRAGFLMLTISASGLLLSHAVMALHFLTIVGLIFIALCMAAKCKRAIAESAIALVLAGGLVAWYVIPQRALWPDVKASLSEFMWSTPEIAEKSRATMSQLFFTDSDRLLDSGSRSLSMELGMPHFISAFLLLILPLWFRRREGRAAWKGALLWCFVVSWIGAIAFMLFPAQILRSVPAAFSSIQFPWRMLGLAAFFASMLFALAVDRFVLTASQRRIVAVSAAVVSLLAVNPSWKTVRLDKTAIKEPIASESVVPYADTGLTVLREYVPKSFTDDGMERLRSRRFTTIGDAVVSPKSESYRELTFDVAVRTSSSIVLPVVEYPVWEATTFAGRKLEHSSVNGMLTFVGLQPGDRGMIVYRVLSHSQRVGLIVSGVSCAILLSIILSRFGRRRGRAAST